MRRRPKLSLPKGYLPRWRHGGRSAGKELVDSATKIRKLRARRKVRQRIEKASRRANRGR